MIKKEELATPDSCINKALPDEMVFVFLARDKDAPAVLRYWAYLRAGGAPFGFTVPSLTGNPDASKIQRALECANIMDDTRTAVRIVLGKAPT